MAEVPAPAEGIVLTHFIVSTDVPRSAAFYSDVLGGEVVLEGEPTIVQLANSWVIINVGGGPTEDKPEVVLEAPKDPNLVSAFLNIRVSDIQQVYEAWSAKGAEFLTPPQQRETEIRCYMRDPDGYMIEVGQATGVLHGELAKKRPEDLPG
jgi:catechol 2,3-dioxygenase-like lactoylglutathione lyase family enzyme